MKYGILCNDINFSGLRLLKTKFGGQQKNCGLLECGIFAWSHFALTHLWMECSNFTSPPIPVLEGPRRNTKTSYCFGLAINTWPTGNKFCLQVTRKRKQCLQWSPNLVSDAVYTLPQIQYKFPVMNIFGTEIQISNKKL